MAVSIRCSPSVTNLWVPVEKETKQKKKTVHELMFQFNSISSMTYDAVLISEEKKQSAAVDLTKKVKQLW